ncbi:unnamed protein product [Nippostrongylus brasiliensis]|uniref:Transposase n=1 Tax=Nippostrongylus brasiliensis TaxID=27835 RepID=A0A0N4XP38_NIPBR|nr:unnamed protein product [Nippostrongylus brasiliensis]
MNPACPPNPSCPRTMGIQQMQPIAVPDELEMTLTKVI